MTLKPEHPYPGLRPFEACEAPIFFGREGQAFEMLERLQVSKFVMLLGPSGSGKSSLVQAGLVPLVLGGHMVREGPRWCIVPLRPGLNPVRNLATALVEIAGAGLSLPDELRLPLVEATLLRSSRGLIDTLTGSGVDNTRVLIVVDQFEELFRYEDVDQDPEYWEQVDSFVRMLLTAAARSPSTFVLASMRAEFVGHCNRFHGLAEAINRGQFLIPRLSRDQRRAAITEPAKVVGATLSSRLINEMLTVGSLESDYLPVLQHALWRTWSYWRAADRPSEAIELEHYQHIGGVEEALAKDAEEALALLDDDEHPVVVRAFQALTRTTAENHVVRQPVRFGDLCSLVSGHAEDLERALWPFRTRPRGFILPPLETPLQDDTVIDISHESLIRNWPRLRTWVEDEHRSVQIYRRIREAARRRKEGTGGLWAGTDLQVADKWWKKSEPSEAWAERYDGDFKEAKAFLSESRTAARHAIVAWVLLFSVIMAAFTWAVRKSSEVAKVKLRVEVAESKEQEAEHKRQEVELRHSATKSMVRGRKLMAKGRWRLAYDEFRKGERKFRALGDTRGRIEAQIAQGQALIPPVGSRGSGNLQRASDLLRQAIREAGEHQELSGQGLEFLSEVQRRSGKTQAGRKTLKESANVYRRIGAHQAHGRVLEKLALDAKAENRSARYREAAEAYRKTRDWHGMQRTQERAEWYDPWGYVLELSTLRGKLIYGYNNEILVGRQAGDKNDFEVTDESVPSGRHALVSRRHVRIGRRIGTDGSPAVVSDYRTLNGTSLNGKMIHYGSDYALNDGDVVVLAGVAAYQYFTDRRALRRPPKSYGQFVSALGKGKARKGVVEFLTEKDFAVSQNRDGDIVRGTGRISAEVTVDSDLGCICIRAPPPAVLVLEVKKDDYSLAVYEFDQRETIPYAGSSLGLYDRQRGRESAGFFQIVSELELPSDLTQCCRIP